jgi:hypothetical protein
MQPEHHLHFYLPNIQKNKLGKFERKDILVMERTNHYKDTLPLNFRDRFSQIIPKKQKKEKLSYSTKLNHSSFDLQMYLLEERNTVNYKVLSKRLAEQRSHSYYMKNSKPLSIIFQPKKFPKAEFVIEENLKRIIVKKNDLKKDINREKILSKLANQFVNLNFRTTFQVEENKVVKNIKLYKNKLNEGLLK